MKYVSAALLLAALAFGLALLGHEYAFPSAVNPSAVEKPRPEATFLKLDEGVLSDMAAQPAYVPTPSLTGGETGKESLFGEPSKNDYHF